MSYKAFPIKVFPDEYQTFILKQAEATQVDPCFIALPLLSVASAAIGNSRKVRIHSEWSEPAMIWTCIVGDVSAAKSPAMLKATEFAKEQETLAAEEYKLATANHKKEIARRKAAGETELPEEPTRKRFVIDNGNRSQPGKE